MSDYHFDKPFFFPTVLHLVRGATKVEQDKRRPKMSGSGKGKGKGKGRRMTAYCLGGTHGCAIIVGPG